MTFGRNCPPIAYIAGIISIRSWDEVKVVVSAPACSEPRQVPAAPASDYIWITSTVEPNRFFRPLADHSSTFSAIGEEIDRSNFGKRVGHMSRSGIAVHHSIFLFHSDTPLLPHEYICCSRERPLLF